VNPAGEGTKVAGLYVREIPPQGSTTICVRLSAGQQGPSGFDGFDDVFTRRIAEADAFYAALQRSIADEDMRRIQRQAFAGMLWSKQFYNLDVQRWLDGDPAQPSPPRTGSTGATVIGATSWSPISCRCRTSGNILVRGLGPAFIALRFH
jgi:hypothetical protein